jgi:hypothetical protein
MRFALLLLMCSIASADGPKVAFVDVLNVASVGDFAAYEGQRRDGDKLVPHRVFVRVAPKDNTNLRLVWFHGEKGKETRLHGKTIAGRANPIDQIADIAAVVTKARGDAIKEVTLETGTCKVAKDVPCTIVRFALDGHEVVAGMSTTVRAMGIASLEIKHPTKGVMWKLRVTGYGRDKTPEWGAVFPADLVDKEPGQGQTNSPKKAPMPSLTIGEPITTGGDLDKAIIRRYVKRNAQKLSYCYEKELLAKPQIQGVVTVKFEIQATGIVSTATASGVPTVADCVALVIKGIEFPKPKDKAVSVVYGFTFKPGS